MISLVNYENSSDEDQDPNNDNAEVNLEKAPAKDENDWKKSSADTDAAFQRNSTESKEVGIVTKQSSKYSKERKKKLKKKKHTILTNLLPPDIQAALVRGDALNDTDSDSEIIANQPSILERTVRGTGDLLSRLPQPSAAEQTDILFKKKTQSTLEEKPPSQRSKDGLNIQKKIKSKHNGKDKITRAIKPKPTTASQEEEQEQEKSDSSDSDSGSKRLDLIEQMKKELGLKPMDQHTPVNTPHVPKETPILYQSLLSTVNAAPDVDTSLLDKLEAPLNVFNGPVLSSENQVQSEIRYTLPASHSNEIPHVHPDVKKRRLRDWEVEAQINQEGSSAIDQLSNYGVLEVEARAPDEYNPYRQGPSNTVANVEVKARFYNPKTGQAELTIKPSRLQRRKHQINQLAFTAAERELELMDQKGQQMRTKGQTQARYGW